MLVAPRLGLAGPLAVLLVFGSPPEGGPPPVNPETSVASASEAPEDSTDDAALQRAGELFVAGQSAFDAKDFDTAITKWTASVDVLPNQPQYAATRNNIRLSVAAAYVERYELGGEITDLRKADRQIAEVLEELDPNDPMVREPVASEHRRVRTMLEAAEEENFEQQSRERRAAQDGRREAARAEEEAALAERQAERESGARIMLVAGAVSGAVAAGLFGAMTVSLVAGRSAERQGEIAAAREDVSPEELAGLARTGERANANAIALGVVGGAALIPAIALIAVGARNRKRPLEVAPTASRTGGGVWLRGRF